ncbi:6690_t:CDS:2 [Funneliformis geosporum]|uniref:6690_t:CDS:1 n=1 Tax=Funneliformis geosporum TaxID=1117311 RepID=A0A9W4STJ5_9GLOM|nr:6690_t:CDS:2 [Funneliformis geosporum]
MLHLPQYDLIIIDGPARTSQATKEIAEKADLIIQPTGASRLDLVPAVKEFHALKEAGIKPKKLLFFLTRLSTPAEAEATQEYLKISGYPYSPIVLYEKASYRQTQNEGKSITETRYKSLKKQAQQLINNFICDNCQKKFQNETAYSPQLDSGFLTETYCLNCIETTKQKPETCSFKEIDHKTNQYIAWEVPQAASQNLQAPETAPSDKRISGRTKQLNLKVKEQTY